MKNNLVLLLLFVLLPVQVYGESSVKKISGPEIWEQIFVPTIKKKFYKDNQSIRKVESILTKQGAVVVIDHGGTRTADPEVYIFITRIARALGLEINKDYKFPEKKLEAIDLQIPDKDSFKWFSTLIKYEEFSSPVRQLVEEDIQLSRPKLSREGLAILEKLENEKALSEEDAKTLAQEVVYKYLKRHGPPIKQETLEAIANESPEAANALLLGPDFNHLSISLNNLNIKSWYGLELIDIVQQQLLQEGFLILPNIQGEVGSKLRQISTVAENNNFPILIDQGGLISSISYPSKYVEFIQRGYDRDADGKIIFADMKPKLYLGFTKENAEKIYASTNPKVD